MRADKFFAEKFGSRTKAAEAVEKGLVLVNGKVVRAKDEVTETDEIIYVQAEEYYVSNGGYKLARAISAFSYSCLDAVAADIGASTGGFTDCMLQNGAKRVYAVDVGESLLHDSLQGDERIVVMDNVNARYLTKNDFPEPIRLITTDVSFISLRLILPAIADILSPDGDAFVLIKPQFECEKKNIGKSGIVRTAAHGDIVKKILTFAVESGLYPFGIVNAPVRKGKNIEYVVWLRKESRGSLSVDRAVTTVKELLKSDDLR